MLEYSPKIVAFFDEAGATEEWAGLESDTTDWWSIVVTLGKKRHLSEFPFPYRQNRDRMINTRYCVDVRMTCDNIGKASSLISVT